MVLLVPVSNNMYSVTYCFLDKDSTARNTSRFGSQNNSAICVSVQSSRRINLDDERHLSAYQKSNPRNLPTYYIGIYTGHTFERS